jgi:hypothetical protein
MAHARRALFTGSVRSSRLSHERVRAGEIRLPLSDDLRLLVSQVANELSSLVRWSFRLLGARIHVSPMSEAWLRMLDTEQTKHGWDV